MKVIILAAGQGTRLRPYTNNIPKCMVELGGKSLLHYQLDVMNILGIGEKDIALVGGYCQDKIIAPRVKQYRNERFLETNMVETLFCAESFMAEDEDLLIAYSDIVYELDVLQSLLSTPGDIVITADLDWEKLWSLRMDNPLDDVESFKIGSNGCISQLGKKTKYKNEIQAQYIGLIKVSFSKIREFKHFYHKLDRSKYYDGKEFENMYMTSFIQTLIDDGWCVKPAFIHNGWVEVDTVNDLELYEQMGFKF
ncbi:MAG: NTP transferase domain-containing protein [Plesiomonas sp.]|uniref:phosphocholine cytidylyltransferase family protein n=1 Tax=Plesiomonas sp. TaxID=2486279 RepID=UPI003F418CE9